MSVTFEHEHSYVDASTFDDQRPVFGPCMVCDELPPAICAVCLTPTPNTIPIHDACLEREREVLAAIASVVAVWPEPVREILTAVAYDLTGVMSVDDKTRLPFGLDQVTDDCAQHAAGIRTTPGALELLEEWATAWVDAGAGNDGHADTLTYLHSRIVWAATNPERSGFEEYRAEVRTVRHRLLDINASLPDPVKGALCLTCGGGLVRERETGVLDDAASCVRCGARHDLVKIGQAIRARIALAPQWAPDALVTEPEARRVFAEVGASTIRSWIHRGQLQPVGTRQGAATYWIGDVAALAQPARVEVDVVAEVVWLRAPARPATLGACSAYPPPLVPTDGDNSVPILRCNVPRNSHRRQWPIPVHHQ